MLKDPRSWSPSLPTVLVTISGSHCELAVEEGIWVVRDLNSSNGTKVNGVRVSEQHVKPGDTLSFAKYAFEVFYDPAELGAMMQINLPRQTFLVAASFGHRQNPSDDSFHWNESMWGGAITGGVSVSCPLCMLEIEKFANIVSPFAKTVTHVDGKLTFSAIR